MTKPDPRQSLFIFASGRKGSGKSHYCRAWFDGYPYTRVVIDITHDVVADLRRDGIPVKVIRGADLPLRLEGPDPETGTAPVYVYLPDMGAATCQDDIDRVIGLCLGNDFPVLLWIDEFGAVTSGARTRPNMRRALHHGRHDHLSLLMACPRAVDVDVLGIAQADIVVTFKTAQIHDRERIANTIGYPVEDFSAANRQLPEHGYTRYVVATDELWIMPPLPPRRRAAVYPPVPE